jgi:HNH endonuclease
VAVPATTTPGCNRLGRSGAENTRPRLDRCSAHRVRPDRPHRPRSRLVFDPPLRQLASDPFHPVEGGSCNGYDYVCGDPVNGRDFDGRCVFAGIDTVACAEVGAAAAVAAGAAIAWGIKHPPHIPSIHFPSLHFAKRKGDTSKAQRDRIRREAENECADCGRETQPPTRLGPGDKVAPDRSDIHHDTPLGQGGTSDDENLVNLCHECHWGRHYG